MNPVAPVFAGEQPDAADDMLAQAQASFAEERERLQQQLASAESFHTANSDEQQRLANEMMKRHEKDQEKLQKQIASISKKLAAAQATPAANTTIQALEKKLQEAKAHQDYLEEVMLQAAAPQPVAIPAVPTTKSRASTTLGVAGQILRQGNLLASGLAATVVTGLAGGHVSSVISGPLDGGGGLPVNLMALMAAMAGKFIYTTMTEWNLVRRQELLEQAVLHNMHFPEGYDDPGNGAYVNDAQIRNFLLPLAIHDNRTVAAIAAAAMAPAAAARIAAANAATSARASSSRASASAPAPVPPPAPLETKYVDTAAQKAAKAAKRAAAAAAASSSSSSSAAPPAAAAAAAAEPAAAAVGWLYGSAGLWKQQNRPLLIAQCEVRGIVLREGFNRRGSAGTFMKNEEIIALIVARPDHRPP